MPYIPRDSCARPARPPGSPVHILPQWTFPLFGILPCQSPLCEGCVLTCPWQRPLALALRQIDSQWGEASLRSAEHGKEGSLDRQPPFVEAMEVSVTHEERAERVRVEYNQVTPGHSRSKIPGLVE